MSIATRDFSKTAGSVWGIALVDINSLNKYVKYFGEPSDENLAFDNVTPWSVEGLTSLSDVANDIVDILGGSAPVLVTYNVPEWSLPLWNSMCEQSPALKELGAELLDIRSVYSTVQFSDKYNEQEVILHKVFKKSTLPRKFGLISMAEKFNLSVHGEAMPPDQPFAKARLTKFVFSGLMGMAYPDEASEA
jgi:hypothetical protein